MTPTAARAMLPLTRVSLAIHGAAVGALIAAPEAWPWSVGACVADHVAIVAAGLVPRCGWLGPNHTRLPDAAAARREIALTFDDGPDPEVTPRVLDQLDAAGAKASFFVIGRQVERHPALAEQIVRRGHQLENHTWSHPHGFYFLGPYRLRREIGDLQRLLAGLVGRAPRYFRAPAGIRSPLVQRELGRRQLGLVSWTARGFDAVLRDPQRLLRRLEPQLRAGAIVVLHDGRTMNRRATRDAPVLDVLPRLLDTIHRRDLRAVTLEAGMR